MHDRITNITLTFVAITAILITLAALFSEGLLPKPPGNSDKIGHFLVFFLACSASYKTKPPLREKILIFLVFFAIASEILQHQYLPSREFSSLDILANLSGCIAATIYNRRRFNKLNSDNPR